MLLAPFRTLGIPEDRVDWGLRLDEACARVGITVQQYLDAHDGTVASPFPGVDEMLASLPRWAVCTNKLGEYARRDLERLGWEPEAALFAEDFDGPKSVGPILDTLGVVASEVVFVGDSGHDRACAHEAGVTFALAGWNARVSAAPGDVVLKEPGDLLRLLV